MDNEVFILASLQRDVIMGKHHAIDPVVRRAIIADHVSIVEWVLERFPEHILGDPDQPRRVPRLVELLVRAVECFASKILCSVFASHITDKVRRQGVPLLHFCREPACFELLVQVFGLDPNVRGKGGLRPLHLAMTVPMVKTMVKCGAYPYEVDDNGRTPVQHMVRHEVTVDCVAYMIETFQIAELPRLKGSGGHKDARGLRREQYVKLFERYMHQEQWCRKACVFLLIACKKKVLVGIIDKDALMLVVKRLWVTRRDPVWFISEWDWFQRNHAIN